MLDSQDPYSSRPFAKLFSFRPRAEHSDLIDDLVNNLKPADEEEPSPKSPPPALQQVVQASPFLAMQFVRLISLFPDKSLTPVHRAGLAYVLVFTYNLCTLHHLTAGRSVKETDRSVEAYIENLRPRSFRDFSAVTTRAERRASMQWLLAQDVYHIFLPMTQRVCREIRELDLPRNGCTPREIAEEHAKALRQLLSLSDPQLVTADLFLVKGRRIAPPHEVARLLATRAVRLQPSSQVQVKRAFRATRTAPWRVLRWESPQAKALVESLIPRPPSPS